MQDKQLFLEARHQHNQAAITKEECAEHSHRNHSLTHGMVLICLIIVPKHLPPSVISNVDMQSSSDVHLVVLKQKKLDSVRLRNYI